ncbi:Detected protein of unknown function [Hibiscus syriacus]|uniref:Kinesin motor domain-containing protein n=1 Tax=Hibiscus syriacus TaxID=106335 RepID=A0A6A2WSS4_HIBSY|nr:Detected protein of unknown function [Hibiscus syriacus]
MQEPASCEERIFVSVRLRPLSEKEIARHDIQTGNASMITLSYTGTAFQFPRDPCTQLPIHLVNWEFVTTKTLILDRKIIGISSYRVFSSDCANQQVYEAGAKEVALSVVSGINCDKCFAYGQTSSGKTYTMTGITEYAMTDIYDYIQRHKEREFILKFSAMEIYNESVRDLLSADSTPLRLLDDPERGTVVEKLTEETLRDWNHFKELLSVCEAQRQIGETSLNETSSRSHQILRVNFVDLAGSERASQTLSAGARLKEGCHINRSLLTLGTVIRKLRLENELRNARTTSASSDSAELLREKDLEIEKLKKEINTLIQQRELARYEVEELRQSVKDESPGDEKSVKIWASPDPHYPKLRVQNSCDCEHSNIVTPVMNVGDRSFTPSDRQSCSSEESFLQLPDFKSKIPHPGSFPQLSPKIPNFVGSNRRQDENGELDENSEAPCKEVRCIDSGRSSMNRYSDSNLSESSPKNYENYNKSSPRENTDISGLMDIGNEDRSKRESLSFHLKNKWIERLDKNESTPPMENEKDFPGRPDSFRKKLPALKYDLPNEGLSRNGSQSSSTSATEYELNAPIAKNGSQSSLTSGAAINIAPDVPTPEDQNNTVFSTSMGGTEEMYKKQLADHAVQVTEPILHGKDVKDVGLDPIPDNCGSPSAWPSEFKRLQREIIELWHACNVSLVTGPTFFCYLREIQKIIYTRRSNIGGCLLRSVLSHGNHMVQNGKVLNPASSEKALRRERHMLTADAQETLPQERENLFLKWGIGLNTHRRLRLAYCLWTDCKDMDHIAESAAIVAKLVGFVDPEKTFKEMFGLNFTSGQQSARETIA